MKTFHACALVLCLAGGCQKISGLDDLHVVDGAPTSSSSGATASGGAGVTAASVTVGNSTSSSDIASASASASGTGGAGPCGELGQPCCNDLCNAPTMSCNAGTCGGCAEALVGPVCARLVGGAVHCWAGNGTYQLALPSDTAYLLPTEAPTILGATARARTGGFSVRGSWFVVGGRLLAAGEENYGELGNGGARDDEGLFPPAIVPLPASATVVSATGTGRVGCAVLDPTGEIWCTGDNVNGELANPDQDLEVTTAVQIPALGAGNVQVSGQEDSLCAVKADGSAVCWGWNRPTGMLGNGDETNTVSTTPVLVSTPPGGFAEIATAVEHRCAIARIDGRVWCWGRNGLGQLGQLATSVTLSSVPIVADAVPKAKRIAARNYFSCIVDEDDDVWCWGRNDLRQLGRDDQSNETPNKVALPAKAKEVELTSESACALLVDGRVFCWGSNEQGAFGDGIDDDGFPGVSTPTQALITCAPAQ